MATLTYTLYDYVDVAADPLAVDPNVAASDAILTISTNGPFPNAWSLDENGEWQGGELDGALYVSIDGVDIGRAFFGPPGADATGYFEPTDGSRSEVTAIIPRDVWRGIIADGDIQIEYRFGLDAEALARDDDYIRADFDWFESASQYSGSPFDDFLMTNGPALILGLAGNDTIVGSAYDDTINGGTGEDDIDGSAGNDIIRGNEGTDTAAGGDGDDVLWGGADRDLLFGDAGTDRLRGDAGDDDLDGSGGNDYLWGGEGNDRLLGRTGDNHLFGGDGADEFVFTHSDGEGIQHVYDFDRSGGDRIVYIQSFDDVIDHYDIRVGKDGTVVTIADSTIVLSGVFDLTQSDITFLTDSDWPVLAATAAVEPAYPVIRGTDGNDDLFADVPAIMFGLGGDDWLTGSAGGAIMMGGDGNDNFNALGGDNIIRGGNGADIAGAGDGNDYISGGSGNDELWGYGGDDTLVGGADHDQLFGGDGNDTLRGDDGIDNLIGLAGDDRLSGGNDRDWLYGGDGSDRLRGEAGDDDLSGEAGDDYLWGGTGDDRVWGSLGTNHLWGGDGADQFMFYFEDTDGTQYVRDFDRSQGDTLVYGPDWDQVVDDIDIRVGKDGSVVHIGDTTIVLSGVFDFTATDVTVIADGSWPWEV